MRTFHPSVAKVLLLGFALSCARAGELPKPTRDFIEAHCIDCHDADSARAGFRIDLLSSDFAAGNAAGQWKDVMDKINAGEMPPKKKPRPDPAEATAVTSWVSQQLTETAKAAQEAGGRAPMRRMNRVEYANTVRDLFSLEEGFARRIEKELPADGKVAGFDRGSAGLFMDEGQLDRYMAVANMVLDEGVFYEKPDLHYFTFDAPKERYVHGIMTAYQDANGEYVENNPTPFFVANLKEPLSWIPLPNFAQWGAKERRYVPHGPFDWKLKNGGIEYLAACRFYNYDWPKKGISRDGWYRFRVQAGAFNGADEEAQKDVRLTVQYAGGSPVEVVKTQVIDASIEEPKQYEFLMYLQMGPPGMNRSWRVSWDYGDRKEAVIANPAYWDVQWNQVITAGKVDRAIREKQPPEKIAEYKKESLDSQVKAAEQRKTFDGPYWVYNPKLNISKRPRLWLGKMEWEGPLVEWPPQGRKSVLFAGEERDDDAYLREIFAKLLPKAYRRPISPDELDSVVAWTLKNKAERGLTFAKAVRDGLKNVLCSPTFLYLGSETAPSTPAPATDAPSQPINQWQLASRLSYLLWSSAPDAELYQTAEQNKLFEPATLRAQVSRMIADPKSDEFVRSFAGQWLGVRSFDNGNPPNRDVYRFYDDALRDSSKLEPLKFFSEVLRKNLPVACFLESDFLMINERLARHYGIDGVEGEDFRRVAAPADDRRGGVLGMAGIMTYLADGTRTLPVRRAAWVLDTLWNRPVPPPPPNVGDLPIIKDKKLTVRERLNQHRTTESCGSCHTRVDPFGMALENYDATGMWRDRQNGEGMRGDKSSPALDTSGTLPDGTEFKSVQEFKAALLAKKEVFARAFTEKLLSYALGRQIGYADHLTVDQILAQAAPDGYRLQDILQATVASRYFQTR